MTEEQIEQRLKEREEQRLKQEVVDLKNTLGHVSGRNVFWRLLSFCGVDHDIEGEGAESQRQIGKRRVGLFLKHLIVEADEELYIRMIREAQERATIEKHQLENMVAQQQVVYYDELV